MVDDAYENFISDKMCDADCDQRTIYRMLSLSILAALRESKNLELIHLEIKTLPGDFEEDKSFVNRIEAARFYRFRPVRIHIFRVQIFLPSAGAQSK